MISRIRLILVGVILVLSILGYWLIVKVYPKQATESIPNEEVAATGLYSPNKGSQRLPEKSEPGAIAFAAAHLTPILFYGRVIDQHGEPVSEADVEYSGNNVPWGGAKRQQMKTDIMGNFRITSSGISLSVNVSKENYRSLFRRSDISPAEAVGDLSSSNSFKYATLFGSIVHRPDKAQPVIFSLHKPGVLEPLIEEKGKDLIMAKDGSYVRIQLQPENPKTIVELQCWTYDKILDLERHYDWNFKMTIPSGGMIERPNDIAFTAPTSGYEKNVFEYSMKKEFLGNQWKYEIEKSFFLRFEDDTYAILDVKMKSGGGHFAIVSYLFNPKIGSRNLEPPPPSKPQYR